MHIFIASQPDYYNALYAGVVQTSHARLQLVQKSCCAFLIETHKLEHIPVLASAH